MLVRKCRPENDPKDVNVRFGDIQRNGGYKPVFEGKKVEFEVSEGPQGQGNRI